MKKKLIGLMLVCGLVSSFPVFAFATGSKYPVVDGVMRINEAKDNHDVTYIFWIRDSIENGKKVIEGSKCYDRERNNKSGEAAYIQIEVCEGIRGKTGISGNFLCNTCTGDWIYGPHKYSTSGSNFVSGGQRTGDGYDIEYTSSLFTVSQKNLGYRIVYRIDGLNDLNRPPSGRIKFTVIEVTIPSVVNQVSQYVKNSQGSNISTNTSYRIIDEIWQDFAKAQAGDAVNFGINLISFPDVTDKLISDYFAKK